MPATRRIKIGVIGCGEHASENLIPSLWALRKETQVVATCDIDEEAAVEAAASFPAAKPYTDFRRLLENTGIEAVVTAATPQVHCQVATQALEQGIHVFVEKPPTVTTKELVCLAELAERRHLVTMVGHNLRHTTASLVMKAIVTDPAFGRPESIEVRYYASKPRGDRWGLRSPLRSFLLSHVNHAIDLMIFQVGRPTSVNAGARLSEAGGITLSARLDFEGGGVGTLFASTSRPHFSVHATVLGATDAYVAMNSLHNIEGYGFSGDGKRRSRDWIERQLDAGYYHAGYQTEMEIFARAINGKSVGHPSFADEVPVYKMIDEIERQITDKLEAVSPCSRPNDAGLF
jgi:predicted dehydrogenase